MNKKSYPAVTVVAAAECCLAVRSLNGRVMLAAEAPTLPLAQCSTPRQCRCRFVKHTDRRDLGEERRLTYASQAAIWYAGSERRQAVSRRESD